MTIDPNTSAALQSGILEPVIICRLDVLGDPVLSWSGPGNFAPSGTGDQALDGHVFSSVSGVPVEISDFSQTGNISEPVRIELPAHDLDQVLLRQVIRDNRVWQGRKAWLWLGLLDTDQAGLVGAPIRIYTGYITSINVSINDEESIASVTLDQDLQRSSSRPFRWTEHANIFPGDTASTYVHGLFNRPTGVKGSVNSDPVIRATPAPDPGYRENQIVAFER